MLWYNRLVKSYKVKNIMVKKKIAKKPVKTTTKKVVKKTVRKVKKVAKKKTIKTISKQKKVGVKKVISKKKRKKILAIAVGDRCFYVNYGPALGNLLELRDTLREINEEQFKHHVSEIRNDFADWVKDVLEDKKTALQIKKTKTINSMLKVVEKALKDYQV